MQTTVTHHGALPFTEDFALVGLTDLLVAEGRLFAATRGDGWLTAYDISAGPGQTTLTQHWSIAPNLLQLETTDLVLRDLPDGDHLFMAGLRSNDLTGVRLTQQPSNTVIQSNFASDTSGISAANITEMALFYGGDTGIAAMRGGGLQTLDFNANGQITSNQINHTGPLSQSRATDVETALHNGIHYAAVSYQRDDALALFRQNADGTLDHLGDTHTDHGHWVDQPGDLVFTTAGDGNLYVTVASAGSHSLSTLKVTDTGLMPVDHILDNTETRFANASHVAQVTLGDRAFILAAGSDNGISLFTVLPGGRLQHLQDLAGKADVPLQGITALEAIATEQGMRIWAATQSAPFIAEFDVVLHNLGNTQFANPNGGTLTGSGGDDALIGQSGNDLIDGRDGDDILSDGKGSDTLTGGAGSDLFILAADGARDVIDDFRPGQDRIDMSDTGVMGGLGSLTITSRSWGAELRLGDDILEVRKAGGGALRAEDFGASTLITGNRIATNPALYPGSDAQPRSDNIQPRITQPPMSNANPDKTNPETLVPARKPEPIIAAPFTAQDTAGQDTAEWLTGFGANDRFFAGNGDDTVIAGFGSDTLNGEMGNDSLDGGGHADVIVGGAGHDTLLGGNGDDTLAGQDQDDLVQGGNGHDLITGGAGSDNLHGDGGRDSIWGGTQADRIWGGGGDDWLSTGDDPGTQRDWAFGQDGKDTLLGGDGRDLLDGGADSDQLDGGQAADILYGNAGNDTLLGSDGDDRLFGGMDNDKLYGGAGDDRIFGQIGQDTLWGGDGDDRVLGGRGQDILDGGDGNDHLRGDAGRDTLIGGVGDDSLTGGFDADEFVFEPNHGHDTLSDFDPDTPLEVINLRYHDGLRSLADVQAAASQDGHDVLINASSSSSLRLRNLRIEDLEEDDFVF